METPRRDVPSAVTPQVIFGLGVIILGVLFTLDNLGILHASDFINYWPAILIVIGAAKLWQTRAGIGNPVVGFLFMFFGTWVLFNNLGYIHRDAFDFWPMILVFVGAMIMWQGFRGRQVRKAAETNETLNAVAVLSGVERQSNSASFRGGELTAFMGGIEIDLRQAAVSGDAVLDVFAMWGGIEIKVPENWTVINKVTPFMGGVEDKSHQPATVSEHRLTIRGMVLMGGIEIRN